jgi:phosphoketolase
MKNVFPLSDEELIKINAYWRAANYLSVGQIYLFDNPLLSEPLKFEHILPKFLDHWETPPYLKISYVNLEWQIIVFFLVIVILRQDRIPKCSYKQKQRISYEE